MLNLSSIGDAITKMNETMYNYLKNNFATIEDIHQSDLIEKYKSMTKNELNFATFELLLRRILDMSVAETRGRALSFF